jgi:hypothetical protein
MNNGIIIMNVYIIKKDYVIWKYTYAAMFRF